MNTYTKYCANVYLAKCEELHDKNEVIEIENKYGQTHEVIIYNLIYKKDGYYFYSVVRADGYNVQERAKARAEKYQNWAIGAEQKSTQYFEASQEGRDFLSLGEPIKVGHHSEKRHRALIERNWSRMGKSVEFSETAKNHESKAEYWAKKANTINLSMPESIEYYEYKLEEAKEKHKMYKDFPEKREHDFSLTYAKKAVNEAQKNLDLAKKLWA